MWVPAWLTGDCRDGDRTACGQEGPPAAFGLQRPTARLPRVPLHASGLSAPSGKQLEQKAGRTRSRRPHAALRRSLAAGAERLRQAGWHWGARRGRRKRGGGLSAPAQPSVLRPPRSPASGWVPTQGPGAGLARRGDPAAPPRPPDSEVDPHPGIGSHNNSPGLYRKLGFGNKGGPKT